MTALLLPLPPVLSCLFAAGVELLLAVGVSFDWKKTHPFPDEQLVAEFRQGDRRAFDTLVLRYQDRTYRFCLRFMGNREKAEEVAQEAFVKVYQNLDSFRGESSFSSWFWTVVGNHCRNSQRSAIRRQERKHDSIDAPRSESDERPMDLPDERPNAEGLLTEKARQGLIAAAFEHLDPEDRMILMLREVEGQSYETVAAALGLPLGTVKSRIHRARASLKEKVSRLDKGGR